LRPELVSFKNKKRGNIVGAVSTIVNNFISKFGGPSKSDIDRREKQYDYVNNTWPQIRNAGAAMSDPVSYPDTAIHKIVKSNPNVLQSQNYKDMVYLYKLIWQKSIEASQDVSQSHTKGASCVDEILGLGKSSGQGYYDIMVSRYNAIITEYTAPVSLFKEPNSGGGGGQPLGISNKNYLYIGIAVIIIAILIFKFK
jgi:hypothetical protein